MVMSPTVSSMSDPVSMVASSTVPTTMATLPTMATTGTYMTQPHNTQSHMVASPMSTTSEHSMGSQNIDPGLMSGVPAYHTSPGHPVTAGHYQGNPGVATQSYQQGPGQYMGSPAAGGYTSPGLQPDRRHKQQPYPQQPVCPTQTPVPMTTSFQHQPPGYMTPSTGYTSPEVYPAAPIAATRDNMMHAMLAMSPEGQMAGLRLPGQEGPLPHPSQPVSPRGYPPHYPNSNSVANMHNNSLTNQMSGYQTRPTNQQTVHNNSSRSNIPGNSYNMNLPQNGNFSLPNDSLQNSQHPLLGVNVFGSHDMYADSMFDLQPSVAPNMAGNMTPYMSPNQNTQTVSETSPGGAQSKQGTNNKGANNSKLRMLLEGKEDTSVSSSSAVMVQPADSVTDSSTQQSDGKLDTFELKLEELDEQLLRSALTSTMADQWEGIPYDHTDLNL